MSSAPESQCAKKAKLMSDKNETDNEVIMFQKGNRIRIAHFRNNDQNYCFPSNNASERSVSNLIGDFGTIYKIYPKGKPKLQIDSVEKASKEINFLVKLEEPFCDSQFDGIIDVRSEDVVNYSLLGDEDGNACFQRTRSLEMPFKNILTKKDSILNSQFIENLEECSEAQKKEVELVTSIFREQAESFYDRLLQMQTEICHKIREQTHTAVLNKKNYFA